MSQHENASIRRNSSWMIGEQIARQAIALALIVWIARSLGPTGFGILSFSLSLQALFGIVATLGLNRIMVREFTAAGDEARRRTLVSTALAMRMASAAAMAVVTIFACFIIDRSSIGIVAILVVGYFFSAFDIVDLLFQSQLRSGQVARWRLGAILVSSAVKVALLATGAGLQAIAVAYLFDWIAVGIALACLYAQRDGEVSVVRPDFTLARELFRESRVEIMAGFSALAFMRLDQTMLQALRGPDEVAILAISTRISEAWFFIPIAIVASNFPAIVRREQDRPGESVARLHALYRGLAVLAIGAGITATLLARPVITLLFGSDYAPAAQVLVVQVWCGFFMSLGIISGAWLMANKLAKLNLRRTVLGLLVNIGLNLALIPRFGAVGAAWATLAAFACAYLIYDALDPAMHQVGRQKLLAFIPRVGSSG